MSHVPQINWPSQTDSWVVSHIWMSRVTQIHRWYRTYNFWMSHHTHERVVAHQQSFVDNLLYDQTTSWPAKQPNPGKGLGRGFKPGNFENITHTHTHISGYCLDPWRNRFYLLRPPLPKKWRDRTTRRRWKKLRSRQTTPSTRRGRGCSFSQWKAEEKGGDGVRWGESGEMGRRCGEGKDRIWEILRIEFWMRHGRHENESCHSFELVTAHQGSFVIFSSDTLFYAGRTTKFAPVKSLRFSELILGILLFEFRFTVFFPLGCGVDS